MARSTAAPRTSVPAPVNGRRKDGRQERRADPRLKQLSRFQWAVRAALALGVAASVCANVLHAQHNLIAQTIAAWPPLALRLTVELISRVPVYRRTLTVLRLLATACIAGIAAYVSYFHMAAVAVPCRRAPAQSVPAADLRRRPDRRSLRVPGRASRTRPHHPRRTARRPSGGPSARRPTTRGPPRTKRPAPPGRAPMRTVGPGIRPQHIHTATGSIWTQENARDRSPIPRSGAARTGATKCLHDVGPEGGLWHKGEPITIDVYGEREGSVPLPLVVQAEYLDKVPEDRGVGLDVPDLEEPIVRVEVDADGIGLSLTPQRARQLAAALMATADTIELACPLVLQPVAGCCARPRRTWRSDGPWWPRAEPLSPDTGHRRGPPGGRRSSLRWPPRLQHLVEFGVSYRSSTNHSAP